MSTIMLTTNGLNAFHKSIETDTFSNPIDPIVPIMIYDNHEDVILGQMIDMRTKYGFRRFVLLAPDKTVRFTGFPDKKTYQNIGQRILRFKEKLEPYDIEIGWECSATLKHGPGVTYQNITNIDGKVSEISFCPLDPNFRRVLSNNIAIVVSISNPFMIIMEDDYTLRHAGGFGCFCPNHLDEFAKMQGRFYSREELKEIFSSGDPESKRLRLAWGDLSCNSLVSLAAYIRQKVDKINPATRMMLCQPGNADAEGDFTEAVTRAFAGKTRPAVRLYGTDYGSDTAITLPQTIFHALYCAQHLPKDFELYHESDTFPHSRFFMSSAKIKSLMATALAYGFDDSRFHPFQNTDNPLEEKGYANMFLKERPRFNALKSAVKDCKVTGCEVIYDPKQRMITGGMQFAWANVLGRLGVPYTSLGGKVKMVSGSIVEVMSDEEIYNLLKGPVFLDGRSAYLLCQKGFGELIGANVIPGDTPNFLYEGISESSYFKGVEGSIMYNFLFFGPVGTEGGDYYLLNPQDGADVLTNFHKGDDVPITPGLIRFENSLGGRVAITAFDFNNNSSSAILNYKKKEIIRQTIEWLGQESLPIFVKDLPNVFCIFNKSSSKNEAIIVLINLGTDAFKKIHLALSSEWLNSDMELLNENGDWRQVKYELKNGDVQINTLLSMLNPVILKFIK